MKYESDYMNEMLNRDYDIDVDEDDLDDELGELERELKVEKQKNRGQVQNNQQMAVWLGLFFVINLSLFLHYITFHKTYTTILIHENHNLIDHP